MKILKKIIPKTGMIFLSVIFGLIGVSFLPKIAFAQGTHTPFLFHFTPPQVARPVIQPGESQTISVFVKNASDVTFSTPICATQIAPIVRHLGCVPEVAFTPGSTYTFNMTRVFHTASHNVVTFSYRDPSGNWHGILSPDHRVLNAVFTVGAPVVPKVAPTVPVMPK